VLSEYVKVNARAKLKQTPDLPRADVLVALHILSSLTLQSRAVADDEAAVTRTELKGTGAALEHADLAWSNLT
jgi:hypothetical protein